MTGSGKANWAEMTTLADKVSPIGGGGGITGQITGQLQKLQQSLEALAPQWQGDAASAFYNLNQQWQDDADKLNRVLMDVAGQLRQSAAAYQASVDQTDTVVRNAAPS